MWRAAFRLSAFGAAFCVMTDLSGRKRGGRRDRERENVAEVHLKENQLQDEVEQKELWTRRRDKLDGFLDHQAGSSSAAQGSTGDVDTVHAHGDEAALGFTKRSCNARRNPFMRALYDAVNKGLEDPVYCALKKVMAFQVIHHVAAYVIDRSDGTVLLYKKVSKGKKKSVSHQTCGGCNYPGNFIQRVNSLRLEMMDEFALIPRDCVYSPLVLNGTVLLQIVVVNSIDVKKCWSVESARERVTHFRLCDPEVLTDGNLAQAMKVCDVVGEFVKTPLSEAGNLHWGTRTEDLKSFRLLRRFARWMLDGRHFDEDLYIASDHPDHANDFVDAAVQFPGLIGLMLWADFRLTL